MSAPETWRRVFATRVEAETYLKDRGFSVGRMQGDDPRGVMFGKWDIRKWRDLYADRGQLHGIVSTLQTGGTIVSLFAEAPVEAHEAIRAAGTVSV